MSGVISTGRISLDDAGNVWEYVPPNLVKRTPTNPPINYGSYVQVPAGNQVTLEGINQMPGGFGQLQAMGPVTYRVVTIA